MTDALTVCAADHDDEVLSKIAEQFLLNITDAARVADLFTALSDPTRVRIIGVLAHVELCVGDLCILLEMTQPAVSHQLRLLRHLNIVRARKAGRHVFYTLDDDHIQDLFEQGLAHTRHK